MATITIVDSSNNVKDTYTPTVSGGVWSGSAERAERVAKRMRTGQVKVNGGSWNPAAPFGGYKRSGNGRELGPLGLEEFFETKALTF